MKHLKILGLPTIAAAMVMVVSSPGYATAETTLCRTTAGTFCLSKGKLRKTSIAGGGVSKPTLTAPFGNVSCDSEIESEIKTATTPNWFISLFSWFNCTGGSIETVTLGQVTVHHDSTPDEHNGTLTLSGLAFKVVQAGVPCYYSSNGLTPTMTGGTDPIVHITASSEVIDNETHNSSAFCPASAPLHATYTVDVVGEAKTPEPLYAVTGV